MLATVDEAALSRQFDGATLARGRSYARHGAVVDLSADEDEDVIEAEVQGRASRPYLVAVDIETSGSGLAVHGDCTCPVGRNCKHVVAVLVEAGILSGSPPESAKALVRTTEVAVSAPPSVAPKVSVAAPKVPGGWAGPLQTLIDSFHQAQPGEPELGLQFEITQRPGAARRAPRSGIRIRPVVRSARGNWVRTGISWAKLEQGHMYVQLPGEQRNVLRELLALYRLSAVTGGYYGYSSYGQDVQVWLEDCASRRLWDLLDQMEEQCVPLLLAGATAGTAAGSVRLVHRPAVVAADLTEVTGGLRMAPRLEAGGGAVPIDAALLLGRPPHGLAWQEGPLHLALAPFARPLEAGEQALLQSQPVVVPDVDRKRFFRDFYPRLAGSVEVVSTDGSVELPDLPRPQLVLWVRHRAQGATIRWQRGIDGATWREDLWSQTDGSGWEGLEATVAAATDLVLCLPTLLETSWRGARLADHAELAGMEVVRFATEILPALRFVPDLVVEEEGELPDYREAEAAPVVALRPAGGAKAKRRDFDGDWFDLRVEVTVEGEEVMFQELFLAIAEGRSHLVLPSGTYFALDRPELAELAELIGEAKAMQDRAHADPDRIRVSRFQAGLWEDMRRIGVDTAGAQAWEDTVRALSVGGDDAPPAPPAGLDATLRPYQQAGFSWLAFLYQRRLGGILADDMGLGKTLQAIALVAHARERLGTEDPFLVVAPTSVVDNWAHECERFAPGLRVATIAETVKRRWVSLDDLAGKADLVVTSYTLFRLEYEDYERVGWAGVFFDEAQFLKSARAIAAQRARSLPAPFKLAMTGTPIENNLKELWSLLAVTAPGLFPRSEQFVEHYAAPIERGGDAERLAQLQRRVRPLMLRRTKEQVEADLPSKQEQVLELELAPKHRRLYQARLQRERQKILGLLADMDHNRFEILRSLTVLRQAALDVSLVEDGVEGVPSTKLDALTEMLGEIVADGHRVLVFSQFTRFLTSAARRTSAAGINHCYLDGRTRKRKEVITAFRQGDAPVFFISLKAGGFGLNLTEADYCILLDPWWNPATEAQAVDRVHRIGQSRKVMVYRLVAKDTIEEKVMALKAKKAALFASVMDSGGFESAALSAADIKALLA